MQCKEYMQSKNIIQYKKYHVIMKLDRFATVSFVLEKLSSSDKLLRVAFKTQNKFVWCVLRVKFKTFMHQIFNNYLLNNSCNFDCNILYMTQVIDIKNCIKS